MFDSTALKILAFLVPTVAIIFGVAQTSLWPPEWLRYELNSRVNGSNPKTYVLLDNPLVVYVKDFISVEEAAHLVSLA
jgi:prolyl 4-hydroxylase